MPSITEITQGAGDGKLATDVTATQADAAEIPRQDAATDAASAKTIVTGTAPQKDTDA